MASPGLCLPWVVYNPPGKGVLVGAEVYPHLDNGTLFEGKAVAVALHVDLLAGADCRLVDFHLHEIDGIVGLHHNVDTALVGTHFHINLISKQREQHIEKLLVMPPFSLTHTKLMI